MWWSDIVPHWDLVHRDLMTKYRLNLHDPVTRALPWPGVRDLILGLLREPSRLADALRG